jgi:hypothetical protein
MTNQTFPITPPPELAQTIWRELRNAHYQGSSEPEPWDRAVAKAYRAGADAELDACCELLESWGVHGIGRFRAVRRPKPPSLKEQGLEGLKKVGDFTLGQLGGCSDFNEFKTHVDNIYKALQALPND